MPKKPKPKEQETLVCGKRFNCPDCPSHVLEEVMTGVTQYSKIAVVDRCDKEGAADYFDEGNCENGYLLHIQCLLCHKTIAYSYEELIKLAKKRGPMFTSK